MFSSLRLLKAASIFAIVFSIAACGGQACTDGRIVMNVSVQYPSAQSIDGICDANVTVRQSNGDFTGGPESSFAAGRTYGGFFCSYSIPVPTKGAYDITVQKDGYAENAVFDEDVSEDNTVCAYVPNYVEVFMSEM